ncbi:hypothetical protein MSBR3_1381 [Methanosarcina barkeri 3]|uniref:Uncharacterized protein n=1 Tax=Methanosarcina barkeri 3 TaxID=1434107 RepID=A0A0E3WXW7_METBA|nr:hypothetical protein MSBR3_1381 [Methanosarcina barkeri 3]
MEKLRSAVLSKRRSAFFHFTFLSPFYISFSVSYFFIHLHFFLHFIFRSLFFPLLLLTSCFPMFYFLFHLPAPSFECMLFFMAVKCYTYNGKRIDFFGTRQSVFNESVFPYSVSKIIKFHFPVFRSLCSKVIFQSWTHYYNQAARGKKSLFSISRSV